MGLALVHLGVRARFPSGTAMLEKKRLGHFTYIIFGLEVSEENWGSRARAEDHFLWLTMHILEGHWINAGDIILPTQNMVNRLILRLFIWELFKDYFGNIFSFFRWSTILLINRWISTIYYVQVSYTVYVLLTKTSWKFSQENEN